jgi:drug/metabolite transporter (DMT)-like permease
MYVFGMAVLFGLGIMCTARWVEQPVRQFRDRMPFDLYPMVQLGIGIGLAWAVDFNLWRLWHLPMRADWLGVTLTGVALAGIAQFFTEVLAMFSGLGRKLHDEAETIEHPSLQRVA